MKIPQRYKQKEEISFRLEKGGCYIDLRKVSRENLDKGYYYIDGGQAYLSFFGPKEENPNYKEEMKVWAAEEIEREKQWIESLRVGAFQAEQAIENCKEKLQYLQDIIDGKEVE